MQAIPSVTPLSRTAFCTSSVMSVTVSPPAVRRRVSCWKTFIVVAILRESLPDAAVEPSHSQWILQDARCAAPVGATLRRVRVVLLLAVASIAAFVASGTGAATPPSIQFGLAGGNIAGPTVWI